jgi:RND family efflux transporter MFP subunit
MLRRLLPVLFLALGAGGLAALAITRPEPRPLEIREKVWVVSVAEVAPRTLRPTRTLYARVDSPRAATLSTAITADVREVPVREGRRVARDDLLVELDDRETRLVLAQRDADVAEVRADLANELSRHETDRLALEHEQRLLELARNEVQRAERLATRDLGSASGLDTARQSEARQALAVDNRRMAIAGHESRRAALESRLARAEALAEQARLDLARAAIHAPFDGRVASVSVAPGDRVRAGDPLLTLFDDALVELRAQVPTAALGGLRAALEAGEEVEARAVLGTAVVHARLDRLGAAVERGRGGADALFRVEDPRRHSLELGRTLRLTVLLPEEEDVIALPPEAIYGNDRVYVLEDSRMHGVAVERIGEMDTEDGRQLLLVRSPELAEGATVVTTQLPNAVEGLKVRPVR